MNIIQQAFQENNYMNYTDSEVHNAELDTLLFHAIAPLVCCGTSGRLAEWHQFEHNIPASAYKHSSRNIVYNNIHVSRKVNIMLE